ncbi:V-type ATPase 116kDa subunit family protein [Vulcanisaeta distributa]|uniref:V-type ATPase 116kDa subunit family protein n=1 Tax=Vulcanisaeta distributa TaxID=164451 RepID=UPI0006D1CA03|nr:V-type ATPase 116kDa subunit family protein [Vulcanisaeta distributa]
MGVPKYTEISPPIILTFILFPAFYGWMYPDLGHGIVLSLFGYASTSHVIRAPPMLPTLNIQR